MMMRTRSSHGSEPRVCSYNSKTLEFEHLLPPASPVATSISFLQYHPISVVSQLHRSSLSGISIDIVWSDLLALSEGEKFSCIAVKTHHRTEKASAVISAHSSQRPSCYPKHYWCDAAVICFEVICQGYFYIWDPRLSCCPVLFRYGFPDKAVRAVPKVKNSHVVCGTLVVLIVFSDFKVIYYCEPSVVEVVWTYFE